jgi:phosphoglycerate dehydrogenase-like enzyme
MATFWSDVALETEARAALAGAGTLAGPRGGPPGADPLAGLESAEAALVSATFPGTAATFARAPRLRLVARFGIGYDNIDLAAATAAGICVTHTPEAPTESTAEFAFALMLAVARRVPQADRRMRAGATGLAAELLGADLAGRKLGLVGCGRIGRRVAEFAAAFRMSVQGFDPHLAALPAGIARVDRLETLLASSDVVSLHLPLMPATRRLIDARALALLPAHAILINTARGGLVDEEALADALRSGRLAGAGLDVWDPEPPAAGHPLLRLEQVVASPHLAGFTAEGRARSHRTVAAQVLAFLRGARPDGLLNPAAWPPRAERS